MNKYEMLYILDAALSDEDKNALIEKFENIVKTSGGEVESTDKWGVKKLAYAIDYKADGYYVLMTFTLAPAALKELQRVVGITENVIRSMITKI